MTNVSREELTAAVPIGSFPPPILVMGAGRSGTTILSRLFEQDDRFVRVPENRYVWNYKQKNLACDLRSAADATPPIASYIRRFFARQSERSGRIVVDKTPSNVLRVGFAHAVLPEARIIHIVRDGRDNLLSRQDEWQGGTIVREAKEEVGGEAWQKTFVNKKLGYLGRLLKRGSLPRDRIPAFLIQNLRPFVAQVVTGKPQRYGERIPGMREILEAYGVLVTAAIQWRESVMHARCASRGLPESAYLELRYEDLLAAPETVWRTLAEFVGIEFEGPILEFVRTSIRGGNSDKWRTQLSPAQLLELEPHIRPTLEHLGYTWSE